MKTYYLKRTCSSHGSGLISQYSSSLLEAYPAVKGRLDCQGMGCCVLSVITEAQYDGLGKLSCSGPNSKSNSESRSKSVDRSQTS